MKLTEARLKQMIKEMMNNPGKISLPHLDKIAKLFSGGSEYARMACSLMESLPEYGIEEVKEHSSADSDPFNTKFSYLWSRFFLTFNSPKIAEEFLAAIKHIEFDDISNPNIFIAMSDEPLLSMPKRDENGEFMYDEQGDIMFTAKIVISYREMKKA